MLRIAVIGTDGHSDQNFHSQQQDRLIGELCRHLSGKGHRVDVFTHGAHALAAKAIPGVNVVTASSSVGQRLKKSFHTYDVVNSFGSDPVRTLSAVQKVNARRAVISLMDSHGEMSDSLMALSPNLNRHAVTVSSRRLERTLAATAGVEPIFIPQGVDHSPPHPVCDSTVQMLESLELKPEQYLLFADAINPQSGVHQIISAANKSAQPRPVVIVETEESDLEYRNALWELAHPERVMFLGKVAKPLLEALVARSYLYLAPNAQPKSHPLMVHALALGRAVVVSDAPDNLEVVGPDAFTFSEGDAADLARVIHWLQSDADTVRNMQTRAKSVSTRFDWLRVTSTFEEIYEALTRNKGR